MKLCKVGCSSDVSVTPSSPFVVIDIAIAPTTIPIVSMHQITPTALGLSCSLVRSIIKAKYGVVAMEIARPYSEKSMQSAMEQAVIASQPPCLKALSVRKIRGIDRTAIVQNPAAPIQM